MTEVAKDIYANLSVFGYVTNIKFFHPLVQNVNPDKAVSTDAKVVKVLQPSAVVKRRKN